MSYSIGKAAELCNLPASTLRYYEREGIVCPERTENGVRRYSDEDITWLTFISLMRNTGMSIADLSRYVTLRRAHVEGSEEELLAIMRKHEKHLAEQIAQYQLNLDLVRRKISMYESEIGERGVDLYELYRKHGCATAPNHA